MRWLLMGIGLTLAACSSPAKQAEQDYNLAFAKGSAAQRCAAARTVKEAYQKADDSGQVETWRSKEEEECRTARLAGKGNTAPAVSAAQLGPNPPQFHETH